ncbi:hypothetical protein KC343_g3015 [Hortaea werneckii]|uniref:Uncharacterized protein n=1 Tax=Hortaea werneckii TaxID=91943 RepID=A0A3M7F7W2_HORWE|nr:hypothetical protein KC352_g18040 [Hortaea werneckii]KAI7566087.1 hypothetical protein KC317_g5903 [Hortaea werneckii]KAI7620064.1 hypothetical protein KC346_g4305 [Hortaea werneckii]KAI7633296.1 hypothetical protein KC343_g3015 [Hortaea werneckii]KAI7679978.1 hypothetical protein KC319_g2445 [Hortaea werneckii]
MAPAFFFTVGVMVPDPHRTPRVTSGTTGGRWMPPKAMGGNIRGTVMNFKHDGRRTTTVSALPSTVREYKCYSVYHDHAYLWTVDYDATAERVGDGRDTTAANGNGNSNDSSDESDNSSDSSSDEEGEEERPDWSTMSFSLGTSYASYAGQRQQQQRLHCRRRDQLWATQLFTDIYTAQQENRNPQYGGLNGELPLLIALLALTMPPEYLPTYLPQCIGHTWNVYPPNTLPRGCGWIDRRGLVVRVLYDPGTTSAADLRALEIGGLGCIFR